MKLEIQSQLLQEALKKNASVSEPPNYFHFKTNAQRSQLTIFSFGKDYHQYVFCTTPVTVLEEGECVVTGDRLLNLVKTMNGQIGMAIIKKKLQLTYRGKKYRFDILDTQHVTAHYPRDFQAQYKVANPLKFDKFCIELGRLSSFSVKGGQFHQWHDTAHIRINSQAQEVCIDICENVRFTRNRYKAEGVKYDQDFMLFSKNFNTIIRTFGKISSSNELISVGDNWACFSNHNTFYFCLLPGFGYPDVDKVWVAKIASINVDISLTIFKETIERCVILTEDAKGFTDTPVQFDIKGNTLKVEVADKLSEEMEVSNKSDSSFTDTYDSAQVYDALKNIYNTDQITLGFIDNESPMIITDNQGYAVMCQKRTKAKE